MNERLHELYGVELQSAMISQVIVDFNVDVDKLWLKSI